MLVLHKWVVYRMKNKRFGNMDQELSATLDGEGVIVGGVLRGENAEHQNRQPQ